MNRNEKTQQVDALRIQLERVTSLVFADFRGVNVETITGIRREFRAAGCDYKVIKNTLLKKAVAGTKMEGIGSYLEGPTAVAFSYDHPAVAAKVATRFAKEVEKFVIKGGYFDGVAFDTQGVEQLSTMPGKDELRSSLLATMVAVPQNFMRTLAAGPQNFVYLLAARQRELSGHSG
jgi:large subunit ribosomal protein L10